MRHQMYAVHAASNVVQQWKQYTLSQNYQMAKPNACFFCVYATYSIECIIIENTCRPSPHSTYTHVTHTHTHRFICRLLGKKKGATVGQTRNWPPQKLSGTMEIQLMHTVKRKFTSNHMVPQTPFYTLPLHQRLIGQNNTYF